MKRLALIAVRIFAPIFLLAFAFSSQYGMAWYIFSNFHAMPAV